MGWCHDDCNISNEPRKPCFCQTSAAVQFLSKVWSAAAVEFPQEKAAGGAPPPQARAIAFRRGAWGDSSHLAAAGPLLKQCECAAVPCSLRAAAPCGIVSGHKARGAGWQADGGVPSRVRAAASL
jgi:hypothetical protein